MASIGELMTLQVITTKAIHLIINGMGKALINGVMERYMKVIGPTIIKMAKVQRLNHKNMFILVSS